MPQVRNTRLNRTLGCEFVSEGRVNGTIEIRLNNQNDFQTVSNWTPTDIEIIDNLDVTYQVTERDIEDDIERTIIFNVNPGTN
jgi:hypothetical protein